MDCCYNSKKVSVIIPTYHNATTIERCIDSILNQNGCDIELIVIIDGDTSYRDIIESYRNKAQIIIKEIVHSGVSVARNEGLRLASGDYILFCDGDDAFAPNILSEILLEMQKEDADLLVANVYKRNSPLISTGNTISYISAIKRFFSPTQNRILGTVYGKVFKKDLLEELSFLETVSLGEDSEFLLSYLLKTRQVRLSDSFLYIHILNPDGIIARRNRNHLLSVITASHSIIKKIRLYEPDLLYYAIEDLIRVMIHVLAQIEQAYRNEVVITVDRVLAEENVTCVLTNIPQHLCTILQGTFESPKILGVTPKHPDYIIDLRNMALIPSISV